MFVTKNDVVAAHVPPHMVESSVFEGCGCPAHLPFFRFFFSNPRGLSIEVDSKLTLNRLVPPTSEYKIRKKQPTQCSETMIQGFLNHSRGKDVKIAQRLRIIKLLFLHQVGRDRQDRVILETCYEQDAKVDERKMLCE